jgi:hypothetical protein
LCRAYRDVKPMAEDLLDSAITGTPSLPSSWMMAICDKVPASQTIAGTEYADIATKSAELGAWNSRWA